MTISSTGTVLTGPVLTIAPTRRMEDLAFNGIDALSIHMVSGDPSTLSYSVIDKSTLIPQTYTDIAEGDGTILVEKLFAQGNNFGLFWAFREYGAAATDYQPRFTEVKCLPVQQCGDYYLACGCGCCGPEGGYNPQPRCYYPEDDDPLAAIIEADEAAKNNPECATAGCSAGIHYACCASAPEVKGATYTAEGMSTALDRIRLTRQGKDGMCSTVVLASPMADDNRFRLTLPNDWELESAYRAPCEPDDGSTPAIGALGSIDFQGIDSNLTADFTLFFEFETNGREGIRFNVNNLPIVH